MPSLLESEGKQVDYLKHEFIGKTLIEVPSPSAVLDISKVRRNCKRMLEVVDTLNLGWRVHIKTHKTTELTKLQVGDGPRPANIIVSTIKEAENVLPLLLEMKQRGRLVNILYGFPVPPSSAPRLAELAKRLGPGGLSLLVDHPDQLLAVYGIKELSGIQPHVYIKIDMGYHRAGVPPQSEATTKIIADLVKAERDSVVIFHGLYCHAGQSYYGNDIASAVDFLRQEFEALFVTAAFVESANPAKKLILSVGATPTTTSIRNLVNDSALTAGESTAISALKGTIDAIKSIGCEVELHAGVYPVLDVQQLATHAVSTEGPSPMLSWSDLALTIIAEVVSVYPGRFSERSPEALIAAGSLALGREPCKAYSGWGTVSPWNISPTNHPPATGPERYTGWQVGRISQEHGILTWSGDIDYVTPLRVGQKIRIWPNHACIAGACFDWYLVFDSEAVGSEDKIIDVWPRWRGW